MTVQTYSRLRGASSKTHEAEGLLARYPRIDGQELAWLIATFPALPLIDKAVMTADEQLSDKLAAFYRDHGDKLDAPITALFLSLILPIIAAGAALWWFLG